MTPSERAKELGAKSLSQIAEANGKPVQTLINWHRESPELFDNVVRGTLADKRLNALKEVVQALRDGDCI